MHRQRKKRVVLSEDQWKTIAQMVACGERQAVVARMFGVTQSTVSRVLTGNNKVSMQAVLIKHECLVCGTAFTPSVPSQELCSRGCRLERRRQKHVARGNGNIPLVRKKRGLIRSAKDVPCADCGRAYPGEPDLMDLDHRDPATKHPSLCGRNGRRARSLCNLSLNDLIAEIAKCDVVCAICHRRRTRKVTSATVRRGPRKRSVARTRLKTPLQVPLLAAVA